MNIAIIAPKTNIDTWIDVFKKHSNKLKVHVWPEIKDLDKIEYLCLWKHPDGVFKKFNNLKLIHSMGAGVDHIINDKSLPKNIPICRISDDKLSFSMSNYIIMAVMYYHRKLKKFHEDKFNKVWDQITHPEIPVKIGILGFGALGSDAGKKLKYLGFDVVGYSLNKKFNKEIKIYSGDELEKFLSSINVLVCTVPYTSKTHNLLSSELFDKLNDNTYLINVSRGKVQNEKDIIDYIDNGRLSGAYLDVFEKEPLPQKSKIWTHDKIQITPHNASVTNEEAAVPQILDNIKRLINGEKLINEIDVENEY